MRASLISGCLNTVTLVPCRERTLALMKVLLLNQTFYPDVASTAQHLTDFALRLVERGHEVTVVTSQRAYDNPATRFPKQENWRGIVIQRVNSTRLGKGAKWRRAADFGSFIAFCCLRLALLPRHDAIVALTSPPLISFIGAWLAFVKRSRFLYWVMDLNPDEAIAAGWLNERSFLGMTLNRMSKFSLKRADKIIALDRFMRDRILGKGIAPQRVTVIPPWSHDDAVRFDAEGRERFRKAHGLKGKFVMMYSGNHSPCHPLDSLLEAAQRLAGESKYAFCFVGGGSEFARVKRFAAQHGLQNVVTLPYQPLDQLAASLSAADLHVVVMGNAFVGTIHPCKIYNILSVAAPVLYIGPQPSHVSEILMELEQNQVCGSVGHGDVDAIMQELTSISANGKHGDGNAFSRVAARFSKAMLMSQLVAELERISRSEPKPDSAMSLNEAR